MELNEYLASVIGLFFIYIILWYLTWINVMPSSFLTPIGQLLGLCWLVLTAIFVVSQLRGE